MIEIRTTAITEWFRILDLDVPSHFNQSMMFRCTRRINPYTFKYTMRMLCGYHDVLRTFWNGSQLIIRDKTCLNLVLVEEYDLRRSTKVNDDMLQITQRLQSSIDLAHGPIVHSGLFHLPEYDAIFLAIHHLAVDGVSWRIIAEDLNYIYPQFLTGSMKVKLPKIRCTFAEYANAIHKYAESQDLYKEIPYWTVISKNIREITDNNYAASGKVEIIPFSVNADVTKTIPKLCIKYGVEINDLLIATLSNAWNKVTGQDKISILMEGHGREPFGENPLEIERIVGWFTTIYPVIIDCSVKNTTEHVKRTADTIHSIPNKGFGYGTLRYIAKKKELECTPLMVFNYLGSFEEGVNSGQYFIIDNELPKGNDTSLKNTKKGNPLSINCVISNGCLIGSLKYDTGILSEQSAQTFVNEFPALLALL